MGLLGELGYTPVSLDAVLDHYLRGAPLPPGAVLLTFDDGYRDNLENALPILRRHGYPAVLFVPIGFLDDERALPHEESLRLLGVRNETVDWERSPSSRREASGSSRTGSATGPSRSSTRRRRRARSRSRSSSSRSGSGARSRRSRS